MENSRIILALCLFSSGAWAESDQPQQIHIAAATRTSFRVSWKTQTVTESKCSFGTSASDLSFSASGEEGYQYLADHGYHHSVLLENLPQDSTYYYQCGDGSGSSDTTSDVIQFKTAPSSEDTVRMAIFGDWGYLDSVQRPMDIPVGGLYLNWTASLLRELLESLKDQGEMDLVHITGDLGYADDSFGHTGYTLHEGYEPCYDGWMQWQQNYSSIMPLMVSQGNHESECHDVYCIDHLQSVGLSLNNFSAYNARFNMPGAESGGVDSMWYSYDWGPVHFTSINTETDFTGAEEEFTGDSHFEFLPAGGFGSEGEYMAWVEADLLKASQDPDVKWIIAGGHRPFEDLPSDNANQLIALFLKYNVSMYFAGHGHTYNRHNASDWGDNAVHIMAGASGSDETAYPEDQWEESVEKFKEYGKEPKVACLEWCQSEVVQALKEKQGGEDPCRHCSFQRPGQLKSNDVAFFTDKLSGGVLTATPTSLEWKLLRAPDALVLDTVKITK